MDQATLGDADVLLLVQRENERMESRSRRSRIAFAIVALSTAVALTGCQPWGVEDPDAEPSTEPSVSSSPSPSSSPEPTVEPGSDAVPVEVACDSVISAQDMYDFNPNFGLLESFAPAAGSLAAQALELEGVACRWINQTSGATIDVSIAHPGSSMLEQLLSSAESGSSIDGFNVKAFFASSGDAGAAQAFTGPFWVTISSVYFASAEDVRTLLAEAVSAVR